MNHKKCVSMIFNADHKYIVVFSADMLAVYYLTLRFQIDFPLGYICGPLQYFRFLNFRNFLVAFTPNSKNFLP